LLVVVVQIYRTVGENHRRGHSTLTHFSVHNLFFHISENM
jgi:hypothetical protein